MTWTRRNLLRAGGVAIATGLAGCGCCPPLTFTEVETTVEGSFDTGGSIYEVPLSVEVTLQRPGAETVGVGGVVLHALDADREPVATAHLGGFTYRNADRDRRSESEYGDDGDVCQDTTVYRATHGRELDLEAETFPELVAVGVQRVWFGDQEDTQDGTATAADWEGPVGVAGATSCLSRPDLTATALRYAGERPAPDVVEPSAYESVSVVRNRYEGFDGEPLVPQSWTPTPSPTVIQTGTASNATLSNGTATDRSAPNSTATNATATNSTATETPGDRTDTDTPGDG